MIRVLLLDSDPWRFRGLSGVLQESGVAEVVGEPDYARLLAATSDGPPLVDVVLLAHRLILEYGVALVPLMRDRFPGCAVLVHGDIDSDDVAAQMLVLGARGYYLLSDPPGFLQKAVSVISKGKYWCTREAVAMMAERIAGGGAVHRASTAEPVEPDEQRLIDLLHEGLSNKEMAQRMSLAEPTIKARLNRLYKRFGVTTRLQLLAAAMRKGLLRRERSV